MTKSLIFWNHGWYCVSINVSYFGSRSGQLVEDITVEVKHMEKMNRYIADGRHCIFAWW